MFVRAPPQCLTSLFQAYSATLDHFLDDYAARKALTKAISTRSVWIYHVSSQSFPGLTLIAGFLTTERRRRFRHAGEPGKGSIAITAVYVNESYRGRGVAESLVRTATRYYLAGEEPPAASPSPGPASARLKRAGTASSGTGSSSAASSENLTPPTPDPAAQAVLKELFDFVSVYVDPKNESTCRVFARVGYGIMDKESTEEIPIARLREALEVQYRLEYEQHKEEKSPDTPGPKSMPGALPPAQEPAITPTASSAGAGPGDDSDHTPQGTAAIPATSAVERADPIDLRPIPVHSVSSEAGEGDQVVQITQTAEQEEEQEPEGPSCASVEDWEVVSLRSRTSEEGRRIRGSRREGEKRLSIDGPWQ